MSGRIDWKTYDYSEGPPKPHRDTNPYSKSTNYRTRESSTTSPVNLPAVPVADTNANIKTIENPSKNKVPVTSNRISTSPVPAAAQSVTSPHSVTSPDTQSDYSSKDYFHNDTPESIKESSSGSSKSNKASASATTAVSPTHNLAASSMSQPKLSYRPPGSSSHIKGRPSYDEMGPMIPSRRRFPIQHQKKEDDEPFDAATAMTQSHPVNSEAVKAVMKKPITSPRLNDDNNAKVGLRLNVSNNTEEVHLSAKGNFDEIWNEANEEWNEADEEEWNEADEEHHVSDNEEEEEGQFEFERGSLLTEDVIATATSKDDLDGEILAASVSDDSVAMMEVTRSMNTAPVGILRSRRRIEKDGSPSVSADGRSSSASRRKHPWDQDQKEGESALMDEVEEEQVQVASEEETEKIDDLSQYEADDHEVAAATSPNQKPNHILRNDDTAVVEREKRRRSRKRYPEEADDDSIEYRDGNLKTGDTLRDRTKQAWSKRNQSTGGPATGNLPGTGLHPSNRNVENTAGRRSLVSFQQDTVHEFVREEGEGESGTESDGATEVTDYTDDDTFAGRSMHSVYTKSNESEAEDFIKDLFFIGSGKGTNPGRRQIRYKQGFKQQYKAAKKAHEEEWSEGEEEEDGNEDNIALEEQSTIDGSLTSPDEPTSRKRYGELDNDDDEGIDDETISKSGTYDEDEIEADAFTMTYNLCEDIFTSITSACGFKPLDTEEKKKAKSLSNEESNPDEYEDELSMVDSFVSYATDAMFPQQKNAFSDAENAKALTDLAINAAKIKHTLQNLEYDEMNDLKLQHDINVIKTSIGLPIGLVFAETSICCWVQKIFETGNAAVASVGDKLQVGDQLAAINGVTAMHKNVADICKILAKASDQSLIELTFIRYIGPLRPASNEQQGYEVIDTKLNKSGNKSGRFSPIEMAKKISFSRPKSPTNTKSESNQKAKAEEVVIVKSKKSGTKGPEVNKPPLPVQQRVLLTTESQYCQPITETKKKKKIFGFLRRNKNKEQKKK